MMDNKTTVNAGASRLAGKKALITGGAAGIGAATAKLFCQEGASVVLVDLAQDAIDATIEGLRSQFPQARLLGAVADIGNEDQTRAAIASGIQAIGGLDILVNNAARRNHGQFEDLTLDDLRSVLEVNLLGTATVCKAALPALREAGKASIVNISSCYAVSGREGMAIYDASKAGMLALTRTLAFEEAQRGIRVNAICPGPTLTTFQLNRAAANGTSIEALQQARNDKSLLQRWASAEEIAWPIVWLASDEASFITGTSLMVDGGLSIL